MIFERTCENCGKVWKITEWHEHNDSDYGSMQTVDCDCGTELYRAFISDGEFSKELKNQ
ncbi:MAG: hypothetical protein LBM65_01790 [Oscillospiraceae bacterium]|jgi:hypothetical protein|nr:hypothetical protein [Oscillospiraceae bacterium]